MPTVKFVYPSIMCETIQKRSDCKHPDCAKVGVLNDKRHLKRQHLKRFTWYPTFGWKGIYGRFRKLRVPKYSNPGWKRLTNEEDDVVFKADNTDDIMVGVDDNMVEEADDIMEADDIVLGADDMNIFNNKIRKRWNLGKSKVKPSGIGDVHRLKKTKKSWPLRKLAKFGQPKCKSRKDSLLPDSPTLKCRRASCVVPPVSCVNVRKLKGLVAEGCRQAVGYVQRFGGLFRRSGYDRLMQTDMTEY